MLRARRGYNDLIENRFGGLRSSQPGSMNRVGEAIEEVGDVEENVTSRKADIEAVPVNTTPQRSFKYYMQGRKANGHI